MVNTAGGIVIAVVVILLAAGIAWIVFTQLRARRLGVRSVSPQVSPFVPSTSPFAMRSRSSRPKTPMLTIALAPTPDLGRLHPLLQI